MQEEKAIHDMFPMEIENAMARAQILYASRPEKDVLDHIHSLAQEYTFQIGNKFLYKIAFTETKGKLSISEHVLPHVKWCIEKKYGEGPYERYNINCAFTIFDAIRTQEMRHVKNFNIADLSDEDKEYCISEALISKNDACLDYFLLNGLTFSNRHIEDIIIFANFQKFIKFYEDSKHLSNFSEMEIDSAISVMVANDKLTHLKFFLEKKVGKPEHYYSATGDHGDVTLRQQLELYVRYFGRDPKMFYDAAAAPNSESGENLRMFKFLLMGGWQIPDDLPFFCIENHSEECFRCLIQTRPFTLKKEHMARAVKYDSDCIKILVEKNCPFSLNIYEESALSGNRTFEFLYEKFPKLLTQELAFKILEVQNVESLDVLKRYNSKYLNPLRVRAHAFSLEKCLKALY